MSALKSLQLSLAMVNARLVIGPFGEPKAMEKIATDLERKFGEGRKPDPEIVLKTLRRFVKTGSLSGYCDIKNACFGVFMPIQGGKTLVGYRSRFEALLGIVDQYHREPMKLMRCFYGLMGAYFSLDGCDPRSEVHPQWDALRRRLSNWLSQLAEVQRHPEWLAAALDHRNLFSDDPTTRYGAGILRGERADFESACERLGIGLYSWVRRRVVISAVEAAACERDDRFRTYLDQLMGILIINDGVRAEGAAKLLNRYARQTATPEYLPLRAFVIDTFGNPLITANRQRGSKSPTRHARWWRTG